MTMTDTRAITDDTILDCGHKPSKHEQFTTGYGLDRDGRTFCYECCADADKKQMRDNGRIVLYLGKNEVTNWPGSLRIPTTYQRTGKHNIAGKRIDVWFNSDGKQWHGVQYGSNSDLCYCKRAK